MAQNAPDAELPELSGAVRALRPTEVRQSLISRLGPKVDKLRQIATRLGLRPYRVFLVHVRWPGGRRGAGVPEVIAEREIVPTPKVLDMSGTTEILRAVGSAEEGGITIEKISTKYSQDDLMGLTPDLLADTDKLTGADNVDFFWEVRESRPGVFPAPQPMRYTPSALPMLNAGKVEWRITLTKQDYNRDRQGMPARGWGQA